MTRHLIHIGYPKTGSTFLKRWFAAHPDIAFAELGIAGFSRINELAAGAFEGRPPVSWRVTSCEGLAATGRPLPTSAIYVTNSRDDLARICDTLAALFPNAFILMVTRGFRSLILSTYSQYVRAGGSADLEDMILDNDGWADWDYSYLINLYSQAFGPEKVITLPFELLHEEPARFLETLAHRLGIAPIPFDPGKVNPSLSPIELRWYPRFARTVLALPVGSRLRRALFRRYAAAALYRKFVPLVRVLQLVRPANPVTADAIPPQFMANFAESARCFRDDPLYLQYAADYLL